ncbi:putative holin-like toxin [Piscibacillus salipiscarius]|nr:putative holin-like toxin [Piscibacillus salipiscarius]
MTVYEAMMIMLAFGSLVALILSEKSNHPCAWSALGSLRF